MTDGTNTSSKFAAQRGIADSLCLNFANTVTGRNSDGFRDHLECYEDLLDWASSADALDTVVVAHLREAAGSHARTAESVFRKARAYRDTIYRVFSSVGAHEPPEEADLEALGEQTFALMGRSRFHATPAGYHQAWTDSDADLEHILWPIAWSVFETMTGPDIDRVRQCANDDCSWLFVDRSRNASRRWCDMRQCGNLLKARRHYERVRRQS